MASLIPFNRSNSVGDRSFANMLDNFFGDNWMSSRNLFGDTFKIDVKEDERAYTVDAEMPGVKKEDISLSLHDGQLTISMAHNEETKDEDKDKKYIHQERRYASMSRSVYLADAADNGVTAKLNDGVLKITVPKTEKGKAQKQIEIE